MTTVTDIDVKIDEKIKDLIQEPSRYNVIFLNDDATPMEWVIDLLVRVFKHTQTSAQNLTLEIHTNGSAVAVSYTHLTLPTTPYV